MALMVREKLDAKKHVFADWSLVEPGYAVSWADALGTEWETPRGVRLRVGTPRVEAEPMVEMEHPWETSFTLHTTIIDDDGLFRLYYTCYNQMEGDALSEGQQNPFSYYLCYAESDDGVSWTKPTVGTVDWRGTTENNIVYGTNRALGRPVPTATVFKDPSAPPAERYKIIHRGRRPDGARCVYGATSPDGIDWRGIEAPLIPEYFSDTQIVARYDEDRRLYCGYFRGWTTHSSGRAHGRRTIAYAETEDFRRWPIPETIVTTAVHDHPGADIYTNGYALWPDADAHLMFPAFFEREIDITQIQLLTSRDGVRWERHTREPVLGGGDPGTSGAPRRDWTAGFFAGAGVVSVRPDESSIAVIPCVRTHNNEYSRPENLQQPLYPSPTSPFPGYAGQIALATWRKDGFVYLDAAEDGYFATTPFVFEGSRLKMNGWTRYRGGISVEIADSTGESHSFAEPARGRTFADCDEVTIGGVDRTVTWNGESDLSAWQGKTVRLRFKLRRARLYAIWFE